LLQNDPFFFRAIPRYWFHLAAACRES
jgi:hypothetical protein